MKLLKNVPILCYVSQPCSKLPVGMDSKEAPAMQAVMEQCLLLHRHFSALTIFLAFNDVCGDCKHPIKLCILIQIQELHSTRRSVLRKAEMQRVNRL